MNAVERIQQLKDQRDRARDLAAALEAENALLRDIAAGLLEVVS